MFKLPFLSNKAEKQVSDSSQIKIVLGLGNPGDKYENTYHNAGYLYIDHLTKNNLKPYKTFASTKEGDLILAKSLTFMNRSGLAAREILKHFNLKPEELLVVHDDSDLYIGTFKLDFDRGSAGHNGIKSVIKHLGTKKFHRLRIGVRKREGKAGDFVLKQMGKKDQELLQKTFQEITLPS